MAGPQMYPGMLSQFGLDLDPAKMKEQDLLVQQQKNLQLADGMGYRGSAAGAAQGGALLAAALGNQGYKTPDLDNRKIETAKMAGQLMEEWRAQNPGAKSTDSSLQYQKFLADSAFRNGLADVGASIMESYEDTRLRREAQRLELAKLEATTKSAEVEAEMAPEAAKHQKWTWGQEEWQTVFPVGSDDPNSGMRLRLDSEGNATDNTGNVIFNAGEFTITRPDQIAGLGADDGDMMMTDTEAGKSRDTMVAYRDIMTGMTKVADLVDTATERDGSTDVLGVGGAIAAKSVEIADNVTSTMNNIGKIFNVAPGDVEVETGEVDKKGRKKYASLRGEGQKTLLKRYGSDVDKTLNKYIPDALRQTGQDAIRIRTNLMNVAYAIMRSKEPGNNRYSDADFKHALELAGQGLADPNKLMATLYDRVEEAKQAYDRRVGLVDKRMYRKIWGGTSMADTAAERATFEARFGRYKVPTAAERAAGSGNAAQQQAPAPSVVSDDEGWSLVVSP